MVSQAFPTSAWLDHMAATFRAAMSRSEVARAVGSVRRDGGVALALGPVMARPLRREEVARLEGLGNACDDWSRVRVADGFDWRRVRNSSFHGDVVLGRFTRSVRVADGIELPAGVYQSTLANSIVGHDALVRDVKLLGNYVVGEAALLWDCGTVLCDGRTTFGNGTTLPLGIETGGRDVRAYAEITVEVAAALAHARTRRGLADSYSKALEEYLAQVGSARGIIERGAVLRNTTRVQNAYVGPYARVDGAALVEESTLLSGPDEPAQVLSGACVSRSVVQWGGRVATQALVDQSVLAEHSYAERHGKVSGSLLGPNTGVAEGEVTACLLGPFVGFHHQALLIATLWPDGKGNVSYGANVGSNHTGKAPDQEFWCGEGTFLGLGVNVKFPSDFSRAPYSIFACGVTALPQKVTFPFSLVNTPSGQWPGVSPAFNEIAPAWVLTDNLYALRRNEAKYRARDQARRARFDFAVFRPATVDLMLDACRRLEAIRQVKELYTERDIPGLGKNYLLEPARQRAIDGYRFFVEYYALLGLKERAEVVLAEGGAGTLGQLLTTPAADPRWEHQRRILQEDLGVADVAAGLRQLPALLEKLARDVERSKAKDDERGWRIIDDYAEAHPPATDDAFVQKTWEEIRRLQAEVQELLKLLEHPVPKEDTTRPELHDAGPSAVRRTGPELATRRIGLRTLPVSSPLGPESS